MYSWNCGRKQFFNIKSYLKLEVALKISEACVFRKCGCRYLTTSLTQGWFCVAWIVCVCMCVLKRNQRLQVKKTDKSWKDAALMEHELGLVWKLGG